LFLTETAPLRPINRIAVKCLASAAYRRAGIDCPHKGAHILRHSAATAMLRHGVSLADVGSVLRNRAAAMTAHYAKVDLGLLSVIAQPWPGRSSC
jgi:site-specific recombinase XerD